MESSEEKEPTEEPTISDMDELCRWNRTMMNMDTAVVEEAVKNVKEPITVAMLDSGVDYSENIPIAGRVNLIPGEDEMSEMYEDGTGHGTAVASVMVFRKDIDNEQEEIESDSFEYEYYPDDEDATDNEDVPDDEDEADDENELFEDDLDESGEMNFDEDYDDETDLEDSDEDGDSIRLGDYVETHQADFKGINPNMELYSIKVLDDYNEAPMSRVIEGIELARENKIKILNLSFGTSQDDPKLHQVIKQAYKEGMLIIASTDNDGKLQYPAAYEEVIGVGSVDYTGTVEDICENDECIELIAPGEGILAVGAFGIEEEAAGTSMAAAEVSAIASILWQNSPEVSNQFIRELLRSGAYKENESVPGFGVVDCKKSLELMDSLRETFQEKEITEETEYSEATDDEKTDTDTIGQEEEIYVSANWGGKNHLNLLKDYNELSGKYLKLLKIGIRLQDGPLCNLNDKKKFPAWHGYYKFEGNEDCNYVAGYLYLSELAREINDGNVGRTKDDKYYVSKSKIAKLKKKYNMSGIVGDSGINRNGKILDKNQEIIDEFEIKKGEYTSSWKNILSCELYDSDIPANIYVTNGGIVSKRSSKVKSLIVYGMALHTMSDAFAHSSVSCFYDHEAGWKWIGMGKYIKEENTLEDKALNKDCNQKNISYNDNIKVRKMRYELAEQAVLNSLNHIKVNKKKNKVTICKTSVADYCSAKYNDENSERKEMPEFSQYKHKNYIDPLYFEEGFALRNIYKYMKQCNSNDKNARQHMRSLDTNYIKKQLEDYYAVKLKKLDVIGETITGPAVMIQVKKCGKDGKQSIINAKGKLGQNYTLVLRKIKDLASEYKIKYHLLGSSEVERISSNSPVILPENHDEMIGFLASVITQGIMNYNKEIAVQGMIKKVNIKDGVRKESILTNAAITLMQNGEIVRKGVISSNGCYVVTAGGFGIYTLKVTADGYVPHEQLIYLDGRSSVYYNATIMLVPQTETKGTVSGMIRDAKTNRLVTGVTLKFREGFNQYWSNTDNDVVKEVVVEDGTYQSGELAAGYYCVEICDEMKHYATTYFNVEIIGGWDNAGQNAYVSSKSGNDIMRIVLSWGEEPRDLDAHVLLDKGEEHIYFGNRQSRDNNIVLDRDDTNSYGPETITIDLDMKDIKFEYYVQNFSRNSKKGLFQSEAVVQIYENNFLVSTIHVNTAKNQEGYKWQVFHWDGEVIDIWNQIVA